MNETRAEGKAGDDEEIDNQWPLSSESVRDETKDDLCQRVVSSRVEDKREIDTHGASGTEQQREGDGCCLVRREAKSGKRNERHREM